MPKPPRRSLPPFMKNKLSPKKLSLAKSHLPVFLEKAKQEYDSDLPGALFLVGEFCDYLALSDKDFKNIDSDRLRTNQDGTYQLYNLIRKRVQPLEEKQSSVSQLPRQLPTRGKPADAAKEKDANDDPPVKITADGHIGMGDEKKVAYRKRLDSAVEQDDLSGNPSEEDGEDDEMTLYGEEKFIRLKNYLLHQIDLLDEDEVEMIKFEFDANNKQLHFQVWKTQSAD
jgi:hypothetical protein